MVETGLVLLVHPSLDVKSVQDLVALAKAKPGDILYATAGKGTATHLAAELFNAAAGIKMTPVHYRGGGDTIRDLLSGQVKVMFSTIPPVLAFVKDGRLRGIATTGLDQDKVLPELPTLAAAGVPGYNVLLWSGLSAPKGTPRPIIDKLADAAHQALGDPEAQKALGGTGLHRKIPRAGRFSQVLRERSRQMGEGHGGHWRAKRLTAPVAGMSLRRCGLPGSAHARPGACSEGARRPQWISLYASFSSPARAVAAPGKTVLTANMAICSSSKAFTPDTPIAPISSPSMMIGSPPCAAMNGNVA